MERLLEILKNDQTPSEDYEPYLAVNSKGFIYLTWYDKYSEIKNRFYTRQLIGNLKNIDDAALVLTKALERK